MFSSKPPRDADIPDHPRRPIIISTYNICMGVLLLSMAFLVSAMGLWVLRQ